MGPSIRSADRVICVSRFTAGEVSCYYPWASGKCRVILEAAVAVPGPGQPPQGLPENYLLFVGSLEPRKNLRRLLGAYASLRADPALPPLLIVGGKGWGNVDLESAIRRLGLEDRVRVLGYVSDADLHGIYASAQALIMPSLYEGFGLPVLEAMQYGVPVIASSTGSLPEVVGAAGLLVNPFSEAELAGAVQRLIHEPGLHASLSARALEHVQGFSWERAARETLALFEETLAAHQPKSARQRAETPEQKS
jgi:glycosyltransferase involved in cell wall biosynthesis